MAAVGLAEPASSASSSSPASCPAATLFTAFFLSNVARHVRDSERVVEAAQEDAKYDFIVVGAGSAGCVLANRLSAVPEWSVLLLEAGPEEPEEAKYPATYRNLQQTDVNWHYHSEPSAGHCNATGCPCPKGRVLGGSSTINGLVYIRGNRRDFDDWAAVLQDEGWSYSSLLPLFKRSENGSSLGASVEQDFHGRDGPQAVQHLPSVDPVIEHLYKAMEDIGLQRGDPNGKTQLGYSMAQTTTQGGVRASANKAFLEPARGRANLRVQTGSLVTRVLLRKHRKAVGVEYRDAQGRTHRALAAKEVVLSAGVFNSPQLLMLSGIGPKKHLLATGIKVAKHLPDVGCHLQNHVTSFGVEYALPAGWPVRDENVTERIRQVTSFEAGGLLSTVGPEEVTAFYKFPDDGAEAGDDRPDINLRFYGVIPKSAEGGVGCMPTPASDPLHYDRLLVTPVVLPTHSHGRVRLRSASPLHAPRIHLALLDDDRDAALLVRGLRLAASLNATAAFRGAGLRLNAAPLAGCEGHAFASDAYWRCVAAVYTINAYHTAGTCRMARADRANGVLDPRLRVRGVAGLRVADASAMPLLPRGNPNAVVLVLAEKAASLIREDWTAASAAVDEP